jgi:anaerobic selenocysteine-containing dehydrogenase
LAEQAKVAFDLVFSQPQATRPGDGSLLLVTARRLFDGGTLMENSDLLQFWVADPYAGLNREDAGRLGVVAGDKVRITSERGALELWALVDGDIPAGTVLVPDLEQIPLAGIQTGVLTPVRLERVG